MRWGFLSGCLITHLQIQHGVGRGGQGRIQPSPPTPRGGSYLSIFLPGGEMPGGGHPTGPTSGFDLFTAMCEILL